MDMSSRQSGSYTLGITNALLQDQRYETLFEWLDIGPISIFCSIADNDTYRH